MTRDEMQSLVRGWFERGRNRREQTVPAFEAALSPDPTQSQILGQAPVETSQADDLAEDKNRSTWQDELPSEVGFWEWWITAGPEMRYADERRERLDPTTPLQWRYCSLIDAPEGSVVNILDVGAGPATALGKVWLGRTVEMRAIDPLADDYNRLLDAAQMEVPVRTEACEGEHLDTFFEDEWFDLVYSRNALDHSYDPLHIIQNMVNVAKPGGWVVLEHSVNEAENNNYTGLHKWNFRSEDGRFVISRREDAQRIVVDEHLPPIQDIKIEVLGNPPHPWMIVTIHK